MVAGFCQTSFISPDVQTTSPTRAIKMLDLLTNRFHSGVVRGMAGMRLEIQMPLAARWQPGQRVRFAIEEDGRIVSRRDMQPAIITHVEAAPGAGLQMNLTAVTALEAA
jgi:hypothetical protein